MIAKERMYVRKIEHEHQTPMILDLLSIIAVDDLRVITAGGGVLHLEDLHEANTVVTAWVGCLAKAEAARRQQLQEQLEMQNAALDKTMKSAMRDAEGRGKEDWEKE